MKIMEFVTPNIEKKPSSLRYYQEGLPKFSIENWYLHIVTPKNIKKLSFKDLISMRSVTQHRRMVCVCNWTIKRYWTGVLLSDLIDLQECDGYNFIKQTSIGGEKGLYETWINLHEAIKRNAILAYMVDDKYLPIEQGSPLRLIDFGLYSYKNVKGLNRLEITQTSDIGYWEKLAGYNIDGIIKPKRYYCVDLAQNKYINNHGEVTEW